MVLEKIYQRVWRELETDLALQKDMARKVINTRALAKYLMVERGIQASLDAVIRSIRRFHTAKIFEKEEKKLASIFKNSTVSTRSNIACLTLKTTPNEVLAKLCAIKIPRTMRITTGKNTIKILEEKEEIDKIKTLFPKDMVETKENLSEIAITLAEEALNTKGVLARIANEIALANINIEDIVINPPELFIFVNQKDLLKTHESILTLCHS